MPAVCQVKRPCALGFLNKREPAYTLGPILLAAILESAGSVLL